MKNQLDWNQKPIPAPDEMKDLGSGAKQWYLHYGEFGRVLHREDGPAAIHMNGDQSWFLYGKLHRLDGPAIDWEIHKRWFYRGKRFDVKNLKEFQSYIRNKAFW